MGDTVPCLTGLVSATNPFSHPRPGLIMTCLCGEDPPLSFLLFLFHCPPPPHQGGIWSMGCLWSQPTPAPPSSVFTFLTRGEGFK